MKILFLNIYQNVNNRGAENFATALGEKLSTNHTVKFISADNFTWVVQPSHGMSFLKRFFLDLASLSVFLFTLKKLPELFRAKPDIVIPMNGFWQVILCKLLGCKILITGHSGPGWEERWNLFLHPDVFVATTGPTGEWAKKTCFWTRIEVIPYGVDIDKYKKAKPVKLNLERPIILCPAAAVPYKRISLAKQSVAKLSKGTFLHIGFGAPLNVPHEDMPSYYAASDVVTLPSTSQENSPMVFLETLAAGKTMVTTDTPRARWLLGPAGIFVDPTDITAYKQALEKRIDKKIIDSQAKNYSWPKILERYENLLASL